MLLLGTLNTSCIICLCGYKMSSCCFDLRWCFHRPANAAVLTEDMMSECCAKSASCRAYLGSCTALSRGKAGLGICQSTLGGMQALLRDPPLCRPVIHIPSQHLCLHKHALIDTSGLQIEPVIGTILHGLEHACQ